MSDQPDPHYWQKRAFDRHDARIENQSAATIQSGHNALKAALVLNGGACLALLSFCASIANQARRDDDVRRFFDLATGSLRLFAIGALLAALAAGLGYLGNYCVSESLGAQKYMFEHPFVQPTAKSGAWLKAFLVLLSLTILSTVGSFICFAWGLWHSAGWM